MLKKLIKALVRLPVKLSMLGLRRGWHITRYAMYTRLAALKLPCKGNEKVLSISHSNGLCKILGLPEAQLQEANYPEQNILNLNFPDDTFDFVVSDQVLEHVEGNPQQAIDESIRVLKPGGILVHTTVFVHPYHGGPKDFWRYSPDALRLLCQESSEVLVAEGWGNPFAWIAVWMGLRFEGVPHAKWHPYHKLATRNHPKWPIMTWVVARK